MFMSAITACVLLPVGLTALKLFGFVDWPWMIVLLSLLPFVGCSVLFGAISALEVRDDRERRHY